jgi:two-component system, OmpR family, sensor histidine kinase KdpD
VIYNLVYNASQYTPSGATITINIDYQPEVTLEYNPDEAITLIITIEDDGHGFPEDAIDKVFEKFYRVQFSKTGGTGLGLSIVKGFVEAQKGKVTVENIAAGGARFQLQFPATVMQTKSISHE